MTKRTTYSIVCMLLVAFVLLGTAVFLLVDLNAAAAFESSEKCPESPLKVLRETASKLRPSSETANEMRQNQEAEKDFVTPVVAWIICGLVFIYGLLNVLFPDFFIEMSSFWKNQFFYWTGWGFMRNPTKWSRILFRIFGVLIMLITINLVWEILL